jgi:ssDNA-binding Zn-finger/Zn-ribbon topoisomerase 1
MSTVNVLTAVLIGIVAFVVLWKFSRRKKPKSWIQTTRCPKCGWKGQTSRYAGRCPQCNTPIGDRKGAAGGVTTPGVGLKP